MTMMTPSKLLQTRKVHLFTGDLYTNKAPKGKVKANILRLRHLAIFLP